MTLEDAIYAIEQGTDMIEKGFVEQGVSQIRENLDELKRNTETHNLKLAFDVMHEVIGEQYSLQQSAINELKHALEEVSGVLHGANQKIAKAKNTVVERMRDAQKYQEIVWNGWDD